MDLDDYQTAALDTLIYANEEHLTYGLAAEVGEVMSLMQKAARHDSRYWNDEDDRFFGDYTPLFKEKIFAELGDVLWYLSCLASHHGFPMNAIARHNLEKLGKRKAEGKIQGNGDNR
jgi:NTP pyrophosphatase (non-canonical NTP hydrolase)